jgi:hypothetical protein
MEESLKPDDDRFAELSIGVIALALIAAMLLFGIDLWRMLH